MTCKDGAVTIVILIELFFTFVHTSWKVCRTRKNYDSEMTKIYLSQDCTTEITKYHMAFSEFTSEFKNSMISSSVEGPINVN